MQPSTAPQPSLAVVERTFEAVKAGNLEEFKRFVSDYPEAATKVRLRDGESRTFLLKAAEHSQWEVVKYILTLHGATYQVHLNARDKNAMTAFLYASQRGPLDIVRLLLQKRKRLDVGVTDLYHRSALFLAATCNDDPAVLAELLARGAVRDVDEVSVHGSTALTHASELEGRAKVVRQLLRWGADFEFEERDTHRTAVDLASEKGLADNVTALEDAERAYLLHKLRVVRRLRPSSASPPPRPPQQPSAAAAAAGGGGKAVEGREEEKGRPGSGQQTSLAFLAERLRTGAELPLLEMRAGGRGRRRRRAEEEEDGGGDCVAVLQQVLDKMGPKAFNDLHLLLMP